MRLIPAIDLMGGRCVRLYQGDYEKVTAYRGDPLSIARSYAEDGADALHLVDLGAARDGGGRDWAMLERLCSELPIPVQTGGGLRDEPDIRRALDCGVTRAVVGTAAVEFPETTAQWLSRFGPDRVCLALDVRVDEGGAPRPATRGWRESGEATLWQLLEGYGERARHVLCTEISRDGTLAGAGRSLYSEAAGRFPGIHWQASGGIGSLDDLRAVAATGVDACIVGRALLEGRFGVKEAVRCSRAA